MPDIKPPPPGGRAWGEMALGSGHVALPWASGQESVPRAALVSSVRTVPAGWVPRRAATMVSVFPGWDNLSFLHSECPSSIFSPDDLTHPLKSRLLCVAFLYFPPRPRHPDQGPCLCHSPGRSCRGAVRAELRVLYFCLPHTMTNTEDVLHQLRRKSFYCGLG